MRTTHTVEEKQYLSCADTAKLVRAALKRNFPGIKFRVRSDNYSGGASIDVSWVDGPKPNKVERVAKQFAGGGFDGMIDLKYSWSSWLLPDGSAVVAKDHGTQGSGGMYPAEENAKPDPEAKLVHFGADFVFCNRSHSAAALAQVMAEVCQEWGLLPAEIKTHNSGSAYLDGPNAHARGENTGNWDLFELVMHKLSGTHPYTEKED